MAPNYSNLFSRNSKRRKGALTRHFLTTMVANEGVRSFTPLFAGMPHPDTFPVEGFSFRLKDGTEFKLEDREALSAKERLESSSNGRCPFCLFFFSYSLFFDRATCWASTP